MAVGFLALLGAMAIGALFANAVEEQGEHEKFAEAFMRDLASEWNSRAVAERLTSDHLHHFATVEGLAGLARLADLGHLTTLRPLRLISHHVESQRSISHFAFSADYEHGKAAGEIAILRDGSGTRVRALRIIPDQAPRSRTHT